MRTAGVPEAEILAGLEGAQGGGESGLDGMEAVGPEISYSEEDNDEEFNPIKEAEENADSGPVVNGRGGRGSKPMRGARGTQATARPRPMLRGLKSETEVKAEYSLEEIKFALLKDSGAWSYKYTRAQFGS